MNLLHTVSIATTLALALPAQAQAPAADTVSMMARMPAAAPK